MLMLAAIALTPVAHIQSKEVTESSGIAASRIRPGVFWTHNDSGDTARLFAIKLDGSFVEERQVEGAGNVDWEDIAVDGDTIWIDDAGNNGNKRTDLRLYAVPESGGRAIRYPIVYPDQKEFPPQSDLHWDCEALFIRDHKPYLITKWRVSKHFPASGASLYRMDTKSTDRPNVLTKLATKEDFGGWVTAADVSPNGKELAVLTHLPLAAIWIFDATVADDKLLSRPIAKLPFSVNHSEGQIEALGWNGNAELVMTNEPGDIFRIPRKTIPAVR